MSKNNQLPIIEASPIKKTWWYTPLYIAVCIVCCYLAIWILESGALAAWDRHPGPNYSTKGPQLSAIWSTLMRIPIGLIAAFLIMLQLDFSYEIWLKRQSD